MSDDEKIIDRLEKIADIANDAILERLETIISILIDIRSNQDEAYRIAGLKSPSEAIEIEKLK